MVHYSRLCRAPCLPRLNLWPLCFASSVALAKKNGGGPGDPRAGGPMWSRRRASRREPQRRVCGEQVGRQTEVDPPARALAGEHIRVVPAPTSIRRGGQAPKRLLIAIRSSTPPASVTQTLYGVATSVSKCVSTPNPRCTPTKLTCRNRPHTPTCKK